MVRKNNMKSIDSYNLKLEDKHTRAILSLIIILVIILLFRKHLYSIFEKIIIFAILFLLFLVLTKNLIITTIGSILIFLLLNFNVNYTNMIENFEGLKKEELNIDTSALESPEYKKSAEGIQELLKKINGGIELKKDDIVESDLLNTKHDKYSDDNRPNALKIAQKETYELINTVNALKDTITTLAPVLKEGKNLMNIFENLKI